MIPRPAEVPVLPISGMEYALYAAVLVALLVLAITTARRVLIDRGVWPW